VEKKSKGVPWVRARIIGRHTSLAKKYEEES
jgi:hypothetical protein